MRYRFRDVVLDADTRELQRGGAPLRVQPKVFELLLYLLRNRERVVPRAELLAAVWPGVAVTDASIGRALKAARRALGEDGASSASIATRRGQGLRFVAPATVEGGERSDYVGRVELLRELRAAFESACAGRGRVVLLEGEAGVGKTRTLAELASWARARGVQLASGAASDDASAPAFWPWLQVLRGVGAAPRMRAEEGGAASAGVARYELFLEARVAFERALARGPLVALLDDLHVADAGTFELLGALALEIAGRPLLIVGAYRAESVAASGPLARALERVRRHHTVSVTGVPLLSVAEVSELMGARIERTPSAALAERLAALTRGNPLYVVELLEADAGDALRAGEEGAALDDALAASLQRAISQRLAALAPETLAWLHVASLLGEEFDAELALRAAEAQRGALEEARAARVLLPALRSVERVRFAHPLFREALLGALGAREREQLHARIARELAADDALEVLGHHLLGAGLAGEPARAVSLALRLADRASMLGAVDRAASLLARASRLLQAGAAVARDEAVRVFAGLAEARHRLGDHAAAREAGEQALGLAREAGAGALLGRAVLAWAGEVTTHRLPEPDTVKRLREALAAIGEGDLALRARLLARLHAEQRFAPEVDPGGETLRAALAAARATGDPLSELQIVDAPFSGMWESVPVADRLPLVLRALPRAKAEGALEWELRARVLLLNERLARGELVQLEAELAATERDARERGALWISYMLALCESSLAVARADFARAEQAAQRALQLGRRSGFEAAGLFAGSQMFTLRCEQGRAGEVAALLRPEHGAPPGPATACLAALAWAELGERAQCEAALADVARNYGALLERYGTPVANAAALARACWRCGERELAAKARAILAPQRGRLAIRGIVTVHGLASHALALVHAALGDPREARACVREAAEQARAIGAPVWLARIEADARELGA